MTLSEELAWRGFINQTTYPSPTALDGRPITFYWGVDPSADSMQVGNLAIAMMVRHFINYGHKAILLVGGATGMIGDPDGKKTERDLLSLDDIKRNKDGIAGQYHRVFAGQDFTIVDNYDWFKDFGYLQFLRDVGKAVPLSSMLARDFVQSRIGEGGSGISYAEFSYSLIQGYDFAHLYREHGCTLQVCGADQWGNSIAGVDLIRRLHDGGEAHVWSAPLVVNKTTGVKFGKSEAGAVWLDAAKTDPVREFYQFWLNADDASVEDYLKIYTLLTQDEIKAVMDEFTADRSQRAAQKALAYAVTEIVHGKDIADEARAYTASLRGADEAVSLATIEVQAGSSIIDALSAGGLVASKTEARKLLESGGIYINNVQAERSEFTDADFTDGALILRKGKKLQNSLRVTRKGK